MLDLQAAAKSYLDSRRKSFGHDRSKTVGASEIGQCAQRIWREKKLGPAAYDKSYKPADGAAFRGDIIEDNYTVGVVRHAIETQLPGAELIWAGAGEQHTLEALIWKLSATPDGLIINAPRHTLAKHGVSDILGTSVVVEMKSFDPRIGADQLPKQVHIDQVNVQIGLLRKEGKYTPSFGLLVYVNASFVDDIREFVVMYDRFKFDNQIRRAMFIMDAPHPLLLKPEGKIAGEKECAYCPFAKQCLGYAPKVPFNVKEWDRLGPGQQSQLMSHVGTVDSTRSQIKHLTSRKGEAEAQIKEALAKAGTKRVQGTLSDGRPFRVSWEKVLARKALDKEKVEALLQKLNLPLEDFTTTGQETERLLVTMTDKRVVKEEAKAVEPIE